jgi:thioredoxin reductase (NADPH)
MDVAVVGDGPGGLSAALFLARGGKSVTVFGEDKTAMNYALLRNYLGIPEILGTEFQKVARNQVARFGATLTSTHVESIQAGPSGFVLKLAGGSEQTARCVVLSEGKAPKLAKQLGLVFDAATGIATDRNALSRIPGVYVVGRTARPGRSQAIISAGDGAAAALDILSRDKGADVLDWDEPPKA